MPQWSRLDLPFTTRHQCALSLLVKAQIGQGGIITDDRIGPTGAL